MALPTVHINEVPDQGLTLSCVVQPEELALSPDEGRFPGALLLDLEVYPIDQGLSARGVLNGRVIRECVRCVVEYEEPMSVEFEAEFRMTAQAKKGNRKAVAGVTSPDPDGGPANDTDEDDRDHYMLAGDRLDLADMLREHVILASPMHPLCRENCQGLCPMCGQNRNEAPCGCQEPRETNPFAMLRNLQQTPNSGTAKAAGSPRKPPKTT